MSDVGQETRGSLVTDGGESGYSLSLLRKDGRVVCGTPGYIPPEVFEGQGADVCSDLYSFGLVLWQMATGNVRPPFQPTQPCSDVWDYQEQIYHQQKSGWFPVVDSPLREEIAGCLQFQPARRYKDFNALLSALEPLYYGCTGRTVELPEEGEKTIEFLVNKGANLNTLGRNMEALHCCDQALAIDPRNTYAWINKGVSLISLSRAQEALHCYEQALAIDLRLGVAWLNKGVSLAELGRNEEALLCFDQALAIDPRNADTWYNKGTILYEIGQKMDALHCYDQTLTIDQRYLKAWFNKGRCLEDMGRLEEALRSYDQALAIKPQYTTAWYNSGNLLADLGQPEKALYCYDQALTIDPRYVSAWFNKGVCLRDLQQFEKALLCFEQATAIDPRNADAWENRGICLFRLGRIEEAHRCCEKVLVIDTHIVRVLYLKAVTEECLGWRKAAVQSYKKFIQLASPEYAEYVADARKSLRELE